MTDALALVSSRAYGQPDSRASQQPFSTSSGMATASAQLEIQLLAQEVARLRSVQEDLERQKRNSSSAGGVSQALKQARMEKARKEAEKNEVVAQANAQKKVLATEINQLRAEIQRFNPSLSNPLGAPGSPLKTAPGGVLPENVAEALERRKAFEDSFSMTLRSLREELTDTSIKRLSSRSQTPQGIRALLVLSDERIDRIMDESLKVPVDERLHIEAIRLFIENCKFRKELNAVSYCTLPLIFISQGCPSGSDGQANAR